MIGAIWTTCWKQHHPTRLFFALKSTHHFGPVPQTTSRRPDLLTGAALQSDSSIWPNFTNIHNKFARLLRWSCASHGWWRWPHQLIKNRPTIFAQTTQMSNQSRSVRARLAKPRVSPRWFAHCHRIRSWRCFFFVVFRLDQNIEQLFRVQSDCFLDKGAEFHNPSWCNLEMSYYSRSRSWAIRVICHIPHSWHSRGTSAASVMFINSYKSTRPIVGSS